MKLVRGKFGCLLGLTLVMSACAYHVDKEPQQAPTGQLQGASMSFSQVQSAILGPRCLSCHHHRDDFDTYAHARALFGEIGPRIQSSDPDFRMPPPGAVPLTADEKQALLDWLARGGLENPGSEPAPAPAPAPEPAPTPTPNPPRLNFAVVKKKVLKPRCISCHHHEEDFRTFAATRPLLKEMDYRIHADNEDHMPPSRAKQLSAQEFKILDDWIHAGAFEQ